MFNNHLKYLLRWRRRRRNKDKMDRINKQTNKSPDLEKNEQNIDISNKLNNIEINKEKNNNNNSSQKIKNKKK